MNIWNLKAGCYQRVRALPLLRRILETETENLRVLIAGAKLNPSLVLDVGVGAGCSLTVFPRNVRVVGLDRSLRMLQQNKRREVFHALAGEACALPLRGKSIPFVSAVGLTEYLPDKMRFLAEVRRVLAPGGYFLATIASPGVLNALRTILGSRVHVVQPARWEAMTERTGFACLGRERTCLQVQYLLRSRN